MAIYSHTKPQLAGEILPWLSSGVNDHKGLCPMVYGSILEKLMRFSLLVPQLGMKASKWVSTDSS